MSLIQSQGVLSGDGVTAENWRTPPFSAWSFNHLRDVLPVADIAAGDEPSPLAVSLADLSSFHLTVPWGEPLDLPGFLKATGTDALVILKDGAIAFETYLGGTTQETPHILMSVTKAMAGLIASGLHWSGDLDLHAPISTYLPEMAKTAYANATTRQLIDMRAGVGAAESAVGYEEAVNGGPGAPPPSFHGLLESLTGPAKLHGGHFSYVSANTDLAGWVMERVTGRRFSDLVSERLWRPMGADHGAYITVDREGSPWCAGGLCVTARDFARVGELLSNDGLNGSKAVLPAALIDDLQNGGDREAWAKGEWGASFSGISKSMSYRSGWYAVHEHPEHLFAMGTHGQNLFVDRANRIVVAKLSSQGPRIDFGAIGLTHLAWPEFRRCLLGGAA